MKKLKWLLFWRKQAKADNLKNFTLAETETDYVMNEGSSVFISFDGKLHELIFSQMFLMLTKNSPINIVIQHVVGVDKKTFRINFTFHEDNIVPGRDDISYGDGEVNIKLFNWYHDFWTANETTAFQIHGKTFRVRHRSDANRLQDFRAFTISVWRMM